MNLKVAQSLSDARIIQLERSTLSGSLSIKEGKHQLPSQGNRCTSAATQVACGLRRVAVLVQYRKACLDTYSADARTLPQAIEASMHAKLDKTSSKMPNCSQGVSHQSHYSEAAKVRTVAELVQEALVATRPAGVLMTAQ